MALNPAVSPRSCHFLHLLRGTYIFTPARAGQGCGDSETELFFVVEVNQREHLETPGVVRSSHESRARYYERRQPVFEDLGASRDLGRRDAGTCCCAARL